MPLGKENELAHQVIGVSIDIHKNLGPGLHKQVYSDCLKMAMRRLGYTFSENISIDAEYNGLVFKQAISADFLVNDALLILVDDSETLAEFRVLHMLKLLREKGLKLGLVINFNSNLLRKGIRRVTNQKFADNTIYSEFTEENDLG